MTLRDRIRRLARAPLGDILSGLTILGLLLYSVSWLAYRGIYEKLGLQAQDVGLTYSSILSTTALGLVVLITVTAFALLIVGLLAGSEDEVRVISRTILADNASPTLHALVSGGLGILFLVFGLSALAATIAMTRLVFQVLPRIDVGILRVAAQVAVGFVVLVLIGGLCGALLAGVAVKARPVGRWIHTWTLRRYPILLMVLIVVLRDSSSFGGDWGVGAVASLT